MYKEIRQTIKQPDIRVVAVSKNQPIEKIEVAYAQGARDFGENYLQEAEDKIFKCPQDIRWHFIGALQSNKTRKVAKLFHWVQTVDRLKIAHRLSEQRPKNLPPLNICLQVNVDQEPQKAGCLPEQCLPLAQAISKLPRLKLRGIMIIPKSQPEPELRQSFQKASELFNHLKKSGLEVDTLSMGMSQDYPIAIEHGCTMVRIGTAIFREVA